MDYARQEHYIESRSVTGNAGLLPAISLALYAAIIPFDNVLSTSLGTVTKYVGLAVALAVLADRIVVGQGRAIRPPSAVLWWLLFASMAGASVFWSVSPAATFGALDTLVGLIAVFSITTIQPWESRHLKLIERGILVGGVLASVITIYMAHSGRYYLWTERASLVLGQRLTDPNHFGASLILPIAVALNGVLNKEKHAWWLIVGVFVMGMALAFTGSRGAMAGVAAAAIYVFWENRRSLKTVFVGLAIVLVVVFLVPRVLPPVLLSRFMIANILSTQAAGRIPLWRLAIIAFLQRPLTGWGYESFSTLTQGLLSQWVWWEVKYGQVAHNIYLQSMSELGVLGLGFLIMALYTTYRHASALAARFTFYRGVAAAVVGAAVVSLSLGTLNYKYFWLIQMLAASTFCVRRNSHAPDGE